MKTVALAKALHGGDDGVDNALEGPLPSGMRRTNNARFSVGEKHRRTVSSKHTQRNAWHARDHRITMRRLLPQPRLLHVDHIGAVDLVGRDEPVRIGT